MLRAKVNLSKQPTVQHRVSTESCFILCGMIIFSNYITVILLINPLDGKFGAIALSYPPPPIVIDDSSLKNAAESFTVALTLTPGGYESAIAPEILARAKNPIYLNRLKLRLTFLKNYC